MIICSKCGHQNDSSNYICEKCGNELWGDNDWDIEFIEEFEDDFEEKGYEDDAFFDDF
ncbi:zinc-ribbon domain-containing protein [Methanobrevibacter sp.]